MRSWVLFPRSSIMLLWIPAHCYCIIANWNKLTLCICMDFCVVHVGLQTVSGYVVMLRCPLCRSDKLPSEINYFCKFGIDTWNKDACKRLPYSKVGFQGMEISCENWGKGNRKESRYMSRPGFPRMQVLSPFVVVRRLTPPLQSETFGGSRGLHVALCQGHTLLASADSERPVEASGEKTSDFQSQLLIWP